jgi:hypothetical protein
MASLRLFTFLLTLGALTAACDSATNQTYEGEPLATLRGTMTARENLVINQPVRLAIAWFTNFTQTGTPSGPPRSVVTDEVTYTGVFPQAFTLSLMSRPPADAITTDATGVRGAVGVLLAYEDLNGDGELTVSGTGPVQDRVLGSSASILVRPFDPATASQNYLVYVETLTAQAPAGATTGYNLATNAEVDGGQTQQWTSLTSAQLSLELTGDPALNLLACSDFYARLSTPSFGSGACGITTQPPTTALIGAIVQLGPDFGSAYVTIGGLGSDGGFEPAPGAQDAGVTVNGQPLTWNGTTFSLFEQNRSALIDGANVVRVVMPDGSVWQETGVVPPAFSVVAPTTTVPLGASFEVSWVRASGDMSVFNAISGTQFPTPSNDAAAFVAPMQAGPMSVTVLSMNPALPVPKVRCSRSETVTVTVGP